MNTYAELCDAIAAWLHRSDLSAVIPTWVSMCVSELNRTLRVRDMETATTFTVPAGNYSCAMPDDFLEGIVCWDITDSPRTLRYAIPRQLGGYDAAGPPSYWTARSGEIHFDRPMDQDRSFKLWYYGAIELDDTHETHTLLTRYPDMFLYGSLVHSAPYIRDDLRIALWLAEFERAKQQAVRDQQRQHGIAELRTTEAAGMASGASGFDIVVGG